MTPMKEKQVKKKVRNGLMRKLSINQKREIKVHKVHKIVFNKSSMFFGEKKKRAESSLWTALKSLKLPKESS